MSDLPDPTMPPPCPDPDSGTAVALVRWAKAYASEQVAAERERLACLLDAEHEKRKHMDNLAAFFARMLRESEP